MTHRRMLALHVLLVVVFGIARMSALKQVVTGGSVFMEPSYIHQCFVNDASRTSTSAGVGWAGHCAANKTVNVDFSGSRQNTLTTQRALSGLRVHVVGDSVQEELYHALKCMLNVQMLGMSFVYFDFYAVPDSVELHTFLQKVASGADVVIINAGMWYVSDKDLPARTDEDPQKGPEADSPERVYGLGRRTNKTLALTDYVADLSRFKVVFDQFHEKAQLGVQAPLFFWKSNTPQHFATPSGMYDCFGAKHVPGMTWCPPHRNSTAAYMRNSIAEEALGLHTIDRARSALNYINTWGNESSAYMWHLYKSDCTHFCIESPVAQNWVEAVVSSIAAVRAAGKP